MPFSASAPVSASGEALHPPTASDNSPQSRACAALPARYLIAFDQGFVVKTLDTRTHRVNRIAQADRLNISNDGRSIAWSQTDGPNTPDKVGFPGGAKAGEDEAHPTFEATDLICAAAAGASMTCRCVTAAIPTVHAGQQTFSFYRRHKVTFNERGRTIGLASTPTIPLRVLP